MEFKPISDIPGCEEFTNFILNIAGELRNRKTGHTLKWSPDQDGYLIHSLKQVPATPKMIKQHRAICCLFKPNPLNLPEVDHINRKPWDNSFDNLRWATRSDQNCNRGIMRNNTSGEQHISKKTERGKYYYWVVEIYRNGKRQHYKRFTRDPNSDVIPQEVIDYRNAIIQNHLPLKPTTTGL
jgi:hypothetical protein